MTLERDSLFKNYLNTHDGIKNTFSRDLFEKESEGYRDIYKGLLPEDKNAFILDIGCGTGSFLYCLKKLNYKNYYGIDLSEENIEFVTHFITDRVKVVDAMSFLENKTANYHLVVMNDVLEHIEKEKIVPIIESVHKSLKRGGVFVAQVPNMENPFTNYTRWADFTHTIGFTQNSLKMVMKIGGFSNVKICPVQGNKETIRAAIVMIARSFVEIPIRFLFQRPKNTFLFQKRILSVSVKE